MARWRPALLIGILWALTLPRAHAAPVDDFQRQHEQAERLYESGAYEAALGALNRAYALRPVPLLLFNMAQAHRVLGHHALAISFYERYLAAAPRLDLKEQARVQKHIAALRAKSAPPMALSHVASLSSVAEPIPKPPAVKDENAQRTAAHRRAQSLRPGAWISGGVGLASLVVGATLWGIDPLQACSADPAPGQLECSQIRRTDYAGIPLVAAGAAAMGVAALLFVLSRRSEGAAHEHISLSVTRPSRGPEMTPRREQEFR